MAISAAAAPGGLLFAVYLLEKMETQVLDRFATRYERKTATTDFKDTT